MSLHRIFPFFPFPLFYCFILSSFRFFNPYTFLRPTKMTMADIQLVLVLGAWKYGRIQCYLSRDYWLEGWVKSRISIWLAILNYYWFLTVIKKQICCSCYWPTQKGHKVNRKEVLKGEFKKYIYSVSLTKYYRLVRVTIYSETKCLLHRKKNTIFHISFHRLLPLTEKKNYPFAFKIGNWVIDTEMTNQLYKLITRQQIYCNNQVCDRL